MIMFCEKERGEGGKKGKQCKKVQNGEGIFFFLTKEVL